MLVDARCHLTRYSPPQVISVGSPMFLRRQLGADYHLHVVRSAVPPSSAAGVGQDGTSSTAPLASPESPDAPEGTDGGTGATRQTPVVDRWVMMAGQLRVSTRCQLITPCVFSETSLNVNGTA